MGFDWPNPNCFVVLAVVVMKGGGDEVSYLVDFKGRLNLRDGLVQPSLQRADVDWVTDSSCHCELFPFLTLRAVVQTRLTKQSGVVFIDVDIQPPLFNLVSGTRLKQQTPPPPLLATGWRAGVTEL